MKRRNPYERHSRFRAMLVFLACSAAASVILSAVLLFRLFFGDAFAESEILTVPDLVGTLLEGHTSDKAKGFQIVRIEIHDNAPRGTILRQSPAAGSTRKGVQRKRYATLTLYVSKGRETAAVPSVLGVSAESAACELISRGFSYERVERYDSAPAGEVVAQSHNAGTILPKGETVTLTVSKGEKNRKVVVPFLSGLSLAEATTLAEAVGLRIGRIAYRETSENDEGIVLTQFPLQGARAVAGAEVALTIAKSPSEETEIHPPFTEDDTPSESSDHNEKSSREPREGMRKQPQNDKKRASKEDRTETNGDALERILDRLFEEQFPEIKQKPAETQQ